MHDGFTPYQTRLLRDYDGPTIPFGAYVHFKPTTPADMNELHEFGPKTLDGVFLGYEEFAGGDFSGNCYVASWSKFQNAMAAADSH